jgi:hypothetical protein
MTQKTGAILSAVSGLFVLILFGAGYFFPESPRVISPVGAVGRGLAWIFAIMAAMCLLYMFLPKLRQVRSWLILSGISNLFAAYFFRAASREQGGWSVGLSLAGALIFTLPGLVVLVLLKPEAEKPKISGGV